MMVLVHKDRYGIRPYVRLLLSLCKDIIIVPRQVISGAWAIVGIHACCVRPRADLEHKMAH